LSSHDSLGKFYRYSNNYKTKLSTTDIKLRRK